MRLVSFQVSGFKNFVDPIALPELGPFVVLHGDNNIGKSNLLKAIQLFVSLLPMWADNSMLPTKTAQDVSDQDLFRWTQQERSEIFPLGQEVSPPITLRGTFESTSDELLRFGFEDAGRFRNVTVAVQLVWRPERRGSQLSFDEFQLADGTDLARRSTPADVANARKCSHFFAGLRLDGGQPRISSTRRIQAKRTDKVTLTRLAETLHAARDSEERAVAVRWERFEATMDRFAGLLGRGRFVPIWPQNKSALLVFQTDTARIPLYLLGSGVQQIVSVVTDLLCSGASIVAIEEPEVHLRTEAQELLREILSELPGKEGAPAQIFLSSHAPTFELASSFVHMDRNERGHPRATMRPRSDAAAVLQLPTRDVGGDSTTPVSWISSDGVVRLTDRIRAHIGREVAGGIVVSISENEARTAEIRSTETFLERFGLDEGADE